MRLVGPIWPAGGLASRRFPSLPAGHGVARLPTLRQENVAQAVAVLVVVAQVTREASVARAVNAVRQRPGHGGRSDLGRAGLVAREEAERHEKERHETKYRVLAMNTFLSSAGNTPRTRRPLTAPCSSTEVNPSNKLRRGVCGRNTWLGLTGLFSGPRTWPALPTAPAPTSGSRRRFSSSRCWCRT